MTDTRPTTQKTHLTKLTGWGRSSYATSHVFDARTAEEVLAALQDPVAAPVVARGAGRSYGDASLNEGGYLIRTTNMTAVHGFDPSSGEIVVDPGVTFGDLLYRYAAHGWIAPVTPGTQFATLGGAIANDVHGKNHDRDGSLGDHVRWLDLALPSGTLKRIDAGSEPELFAATIGGIGLTGVITRICLQMKRVPGSMLLVRERRAASLDEYLDALQEARTTCRYSVGWIDGLASGRSLGRGILETADHIEDPQPIRRRWRAHMPIDLPELAFNSWSIGLFNQLYYHRIPARGRERRLDLAQFFYPLDAITDWNRMYGRRGFVQFQCVIPDGEARAALHALLRAISASGLASFLAVIKTLGRAGLGCLSFPAPGITLALDFPIRDNTAALLARLHGITADHGGRIYLAKDSCVPAELLPQMYPRLTQFRTVLGQIDPQRRMRSDMSNRLQL
jgi:decaprenylphospho-beta-D-ribofuranose 2-oxidase